jgi:hypothetical protein
MSERTETLETLHGVGPLNEADQAAFDQLEQEVKAEVSAEEASGIGVAPVKRYVEVDNTVIPEAQAQELRAAGQDVTVHASAGRRS